MNNIKFPDLNEDESFELLASLDIGKQFEISTVEKYISDWFFIHSNKKVFGRSLEEEFESVPKARLQDGILILQFIGSPSRDCCWSDRVWKDWFVMLVSELIEGHLEIIKLIGCKSAKNI